VTEGFTILLSAVTTPEPSDKVVFHKTRWTQLHCFWHCMGTTEL